jgi:hypothetical protein
MKLIPKLIPINTVVTHHAIRNHGEPRYVRQYKPKRPAFAAYTTSQKSSSVASSTFTENVRLSIDGRLLLIPNPNSCACCSVGRMSVIDATKSTRRTAASPLRQSSMKKRDDCFHCMYKRPHVIKTLAEANVQPMPLKTLARDRTS